MKSRVLKDGTISHNIGLTCQAFEHPDHLTVHIYRLGKENGVVKRKKLDHHITFSFKKNFNIYKYNCIDKSIRCVTNKSYHVLMFLKNIGVALPDKKIEGKVDKSPWGPTPPKTTPNHRKKGIHQFTQTQAIKGIVKRMYKKKYGFFPNIPLKNKFIFTWLAYPGLLRLIGVENAKNLSVRRFFSIPTEITHILRHRDPTQAIKRVFKGKGKKILKLIFQNFKLQGLNFVPSFMLLRAFKSWFEISHLQELAQPITSQYLSETENIYPAREFLQVFSKKRALNFIKGSVGDGRYTYADIIRQYRANPTFFDIDPSRSFEDIHNDVSRQFRRKEQKNFELVKKLGHKVHKKKVKDLMLKVPEKSYDLLDWGNEMNNCIFSYANRYNQQDSLELFAVEKEGKMLYNIEVSEGKLRQFYGKRNQSPDPKDKEEIIKFLKKEKILSEAAYL